MGGGDGLDSGLDSGGDGDIYYIDNFSNSFEDDVFVEGFNNKFYFGLCD